MTCDTHEDGHLEGTIEARGEARSCDHSALLTNDNHYTHTNISPDNNNDSRTEQEEEGPQ